MRRPAGLAHRFFQYAGGIAIASVTLAELYSGAYKRPQPARLLALIADLRQDVAVLDFDTVCAEQLGRFAWRGAAWVSGPRRSAGRKRGGTAAGSGLSQALPLTGRNSRGSGTLPRASGGSVKP